MRQRYPNEVKGIIGLDMAVPQAYEDFTINRLMLNIGKFSANVGIVRFLPAVVNSSASIEYGTLTKEEKDLYKAVFYRKTLTKSMVREVDEIEVSAEKVKKMGRPDIPMLFFISNRVGTGWDEEKWVELQTSYIEATNSNQYIKLNCGHYVHNIAYEEIAEKSKRFIEDIINMRENDIN